ncbi:MAG TPA: DUF3880 domain-containing protein, partial [Nitrospiraceae bacterium]|nr:DUF3880 domain-containing protein [Nitrospiraceae bacterium]
MNIFEANVAALAASHSSLASAVKEAGGGVLTVTAARNGLPTAQRNGRWIHSAYDPVREAEAWAAEHSSSCRPGETLAIMGVGLLYHAEALRRYVAPATKLAIVAPDLRELHDACAARPLSDLLTNAAWLTGRPEDVAEALALLGGPLRLVSYAPTTALQAAYYDALEQHVRRRIASQAGGQLNIAVVGPIYGGSLPIARYTARALEELGHKVRWIDHSVHARSYEQFGYVTDRRNRQIIQSRFADVLSQSTLAQLVEDPPDVVLALAQAPLTAAVLDHLRRKKFLCAIWFVENYRHLTYWQQLAGGYDYWFVIQQASCREALKQAGARDVVYLPMAADPVIHRPMEL